MALEGNILRGPTLDGSELNKNIKIIKEKFGRLRESSESKGKEKALLPDVPSDVAADGGDEMNLG